ncbi:MAG: 50S ribosomal protein L25 [Parcubacteria group bacterium]|nr:50S ribosomal protein L25 [Parcubacteria group bacterium]
MLELSVKLRKETGRKNKQIREQDLIPAVLYGHKIKNILLSVKKHSFEKIYEEAGESTLIELNIASDEEKSKKERVVLIHDIAKDPVSSEVIHIDFYQVKMDEPITTEIPLIFNGKSLAVEREGGVLIKSIQAIEIKALPQDLPREIEVDISSLKTFNDNIYIKDLKIPDKVETTVDLEEVVASVIPPRTVTELEELEQAPVEEVEKVEEEKKGAEEEEETIDEEEQKSGQEQKENE